LEVSGKDWAGAFTQSSPADLRQNYAKNSILESYLIAQKIPRKLRPLKRGVWLFFASTVVLVVLLPLCAVTVVFVDISPATAPSSVKPDTSNVCPGSQMSPAPKVIANSVAKDDTKETNSGDNHDKSKIKSGEQQPQQHAR
jgi:hypothetical protein